MCVLIDQLTKSIPSSAGEFENGVLIVLGQHPPIMALPVPSFGFINETSPSEPQPHHSPISAPIF